MNNKSRRNIMQNPQIRKLMLWMAFGFVLLFVSASMLSASEKGALEFNALESAALETTILDFDALHSATLESTSPESAAPRIILAAKAKKPAADIAQEKYACDVGYGFSCFKVAQELLFGGANDVEGARAYYYRACALGFREGCYEFAKIQASPDEMYKAYWRLWERGES